MRDDTNWSPRFVLYGDMGNVNAQSLPRLQQEVQKDMYDAVLHVGEYVENLLRLYLQKTIFVFFSDSMFHFCCFDMNEGFRSVSI